MENARTKARSGVSCTTSFAVIRMICTVMCSPSAYAFSKKTKRGVATMCKIMEEIRKDGEVQGAETERLKNIKSLIQRMGVTAEVAMDVLNIAKDDQPKYLALL